ncbi:hypothetical protein [Arcobacter arenosus]|uniref:hypothetical protein n=1 Tax=Arcobacter arenosus TaxID=2576037 RepID=UPI003BAB61AB
MERIFVTLLLIMIAVASFMGINSWFNDEKTTMMNTTTSQIEKAKNDIQDNIK